MNATSASIRCSSAGRISQEMTPTTQLSRALTPAEAVDSSDKDTTSSSRDGSSLVRQVPIYLVGRVIPAALSFVSLAAFTRYLTPTQFGVYSMVIASTGLVNALLYSWINASVLRLLPAANDRGAFLALTRSLFTTVTAGISVTSIVLLLVLPSQHRVALLLVLTVTLAQSWFRLHQAVFRAEMRPVLFSALEIARAVGILAFGVLLAQLGYGANGVIAGVVLAYLMPALFTISAVWTGTSKPEADAASARRSFLAYGLPTIASLAFSFVVRSSDRLMLGWLSSPSSAGLYSAGYDLAFQTVDSLLMVANLAAFPLLVRAAEKGDPDDVRKQATQNMELLTAIGLPTTLGLSLLSGELSRTLLGADFATSGTALVPIICVAAMLAGYKSYYFDHAFHVGRRTMTLVTIGAIAASLNVLLNLVAIPRYGGLGAAWATVGSFAVGLVLSWAGGRRVLKMPIPWAQIAPIVAASLAMSAVILLLPSALGALQVAAKLATAGLSYAVVAIALDVCGLRTRLARWRRR